MKNKNLGFEKHQKLIIPANLRDRYESVKNEVINRYYQEKQRELQQGLIQELFTQFGALVHDDVVLGKKKESTEAPHPKETEKK